MKDEIKEILDKLKNSSWEKDTEEIAYKILFSNEIYKLLDYITNLQKENERLNKIIISFRKELKSVYNHLTIKDLNYKSRNEKATNEIQYIIDYGFDYDGLNTVESLKGLIDMLVDYAVKSKNILQGSDEE